MKIGLVRLCRETYVGGECWWGAKEGRVAFRLGLSFTLTSVANNTRRGGQRKKEIFAAKNGGNKRCGATL
jgi:hypothetical protein